MYKKVMILGSTGSVGTQTIDAVISEKDSVIGIAANSDTVKLEKQIRELSPLFCAVTDPEAAKRLKIAVGDTNTEIISGYDAMCEAVGEYECDIVFNSISGKNGLLPTLAALRSGKTLALANKESMVCAGQIVNDTAKKYGGKILPVDSEHCAIFQCLQNGKADEVQRILLTASGGPFFGYSKEQLEKVTLEDALKHPTWNMGKKITIDSATLANKGLEIIEAVYLFGVSAEMIEVLVHRESIIHSMVEYKDNGVIAQLGVPDMRYPAKFALTYPDKTEGLVGRLDLTKLCTLSFYKPDTEAFPHLSLARKAAGEGGVMPCAFNAANEAAVDLFLKRKISFGEIYISTLYGYSKVNNVPDPTLDDVFYADKVARDAVYTFDWRK